VFVAWWVVLDGDDNDIAVEGQQHRFSLLWTPFLWFVVFLDVVFLMVALRVCMW
jgi:hypothetical protein